MRLNKLLANRSGLSRRAADAAIQAGRVEVDGVVQSNPATETPEAARIELDGKRQAARQLLTIALNKPRGVVSTTASFPGQQSVLEVIAASRQANKDTLKTIVDLAPAGRLDSASRGLVILTNDGELQNIITHPKNNIVKKYELFLKSYPDLTALCLAACSGVADKETKEHLRVDRCSVKRREDEAAVLQVELHQGRKHELRRLFRALGAPLLDVNRIAIGHLSLGALHLQPGQWTILTVSQIKLLTVTPPAYPPRRSKKVRP